MKTIELTDGGILLYEEAFLLSDLADRYFAELGDNCAWELKPGVFGQMQPRLIAPYGDEGVTYRIILRSSTISKEGRSSCFQDPLPLKDFLNSTVIWNRGRDLAVWKWQAPICC